MRILFIGCVKFSENSLLKLIQLKANVVGIATKSQSGYNSDFVDLSYIADMNKIPYKHVNDINHPNNIKWIESLSPDIIFCFGWSSLIKSDLLNLTNLGVVGYHPALLPNNKGRHPLIWAKVLGLKESGSTFFFMDEGADTGDILDQSTFEIFFEDDINDIYNKMTQVALKQIESFYPKLVSGNFQKKKQEATGNTWRKRSKLDGRIDFRMTTTAICNLVRALTIPFPGANCTINNIDYSVWKVDKGDDANPNIEPGKVIKRINNKIEVKTGDGSIILVEHLIPDTIELDYI